MESKLKFMLITIFGLTSVLGVIFTSLLIHEGIHILQLGEAESICYDMQQDTFMHVSHDLNKVYNGKIIYDKNIGYWEKQAVIGENIFLVLLSMLMGFILRR